MKSAIKSVGILLVCLGLSGCLSKHVVRDRDAWEAEAVFINNLVTAEQQGLEALMARSCRCNAQGEWVDANNGADRVCAQAADAVVVVRARWAWHYEMMLFNSGVTEKRPNGDAPPIPEAASLCEEMNNAQ